MAWPFSRLRTYVASSTPSVKAADLNAIQDEAVNNHVVCEPTPPTIGVATPQMLFRDTAGNNRTLVDQHGFPGGTFDSFREEWFSPISVGASASGQLANNPIWTYATSANAALDSQIASSTYPANYLRLTPGTANMNEAVVHMGSFFPADVTSLILDFDFKVSAAGTNNEKWQIGFTGLFSGDPDGSSYETASFQLNSGASSKWHAVDGKAAGGGDSVDTGVTADTAWHRFHIEVHGVSTPIGVSTAYGLNANSKKVLYYIDGVKTNAFDSVANVPPVANMDFAVHGYCTGAATAVGYIGPIRIAWNRYASIDAL